MIKTITIKNKILRYEDIENNLSIEFKLNDFAILIEGVGMIRADYLVEMLKDYKNRPNRLSIQRKLDKYKK